MTAEDEIMARICMGLALSQRGQREAARQLFLEIWDDIGPAGDPVHRCALAHSMADVQDEAAEELVWDLRALEAADLISDERSRQGGVSIPVSGFYPSLHLTRRGLPQARGPPVSPRPPPARTGSRWRPRR